MIALARPTSGSGTTRNADVVLALARQRIFDTHIANALALIERARGDLQAPDAFQLYCRLHRIEDDAATMLRHQLLVHVGRAVAEQSQWADAVVFDCAREWGGPTSPFDRFRKRLGGRQNPDLRRWIERHSGFVERILLDVHLDNLIDLWEAMGPAVSEAGVVDAYTDHVNVPGAAVPILLEGLLGHGFEQRERNHRGGIVLAPAPVRPESAGAESASPLRVTSIIARLFETRLREV